MKGSCGKETFSFESVVMPTCPLHTTSENELTID